MLRIEFVIDKVVRARATLDRTQCRLTERRSNDRMVLAWCGFFGISKTLLIVSC